MKQKSDVPVSSLTVKAQTLKLITGAFPLNLLSPEAHKLITGAFLDAHKLIKAAFPDAQIDHRSFPIEPAFGDTSAAKTSTFLPR